MVSAAKVEILRIEFFIVIVPVPLPEPLRLGRRLPAPEQPLRRVVQLDLESRV